MNDQKFIGREDFKKILKLSYQLIGRGADIRIPSYSKLLELSLIWLVGDVKDKNEQKKASVYRLSKK